MDANHLLVWLVGTSALAGLVVLWRRHRARLRGWLAVHALNAAVVAAGLACWPDVAGWVGLAVWAPTVGLPSLLNRVMGKRVAAGRYADARRLGRLAGLLHPLDGWRELPLLLAAHEALRAGDREAAIARFAEVEARGGPAAPEAGLQRLRLELRWAELRARVEEDPRVEAVLRDPASLFAYLRALGELGDTAAVVDVYRRRAEPLATAIGMRWLATGKMMLAAYTGQVEAVRRLLRSPWVQVPPAHEAFWLATAWQTAGQPEAAAPILQQLVDLGDGVVRPAARRRLDAPLAPVDPQRLPVGAQVAVAGLELAAEDLVRHGTVANPPPGPAPRATWAFITLNLACYAAEIPGGTTSARNLIELGALLAPAEELRGEWWRVATAAFLHYGALHLAMNMLGLWFFGRYLERVLGTPRFAALYGLAAPGSMALIVASVTLFGAPPQLVVGASGGVMALLGAILAVLLLRWRLTRARMAGRDAALLLTMLVLQTGFDLATPEVSFTGHAAGALLGFLLGLVLTPRRRLVAQPPAAARRPARGT